MGNEAQVLVTGGTGFIGRYLVRQLLQEGLAVRVLARSEKKAQRLFGDTIQVWRGDLTDSKSLHGVCRGVRTVFHLGGAYSFGPAGRERLWQANVEGTDRIMAEAWAAQVHKVVQVSSCSVLEGKGILTENHVPETLPRSSHYRFSKWQGELVAWRWAKKGLPVVVVNPSSPLGAEDERPTPTGRMILDFLRHRFPFSARTGLNFIQVGELAAGLRVVAQRGVVGERYVISGENVWLSDFLARLGEMTGQAPPRFVLPWGLIAAAGWVGEAAGYFSPLWGERLCRETAAHARGARFFEAGKMRRELGWEPQTPWDTGLLEAVRWFRERALPDVTVDSRLAMARSG
jgi:dihydroflavonol-4-reductase